MIALLQRVTKARVVVESKTVGAIENGILALIGIEKTDTQEHANRLLERILGYRIFADTQDKMNLSLEDINGGLLIVPQFTLAADTRTGRRPGFSAAADPSEGEKWFEYFAGQAATRHAEVETGRFGAEMQVGLVNDGPVTFWLQVPPD